jgi:hypothetical protein
VNSLRARRAAGRAAKGLLCVLAGAVFAGHALAQSADAASQEAAPSSGPSVDPEARAIAKDAWLYAFAPIANYRILYLEALDKTSSSYTGGFGVYRHEATIHAAKDQESQFPDTDMAYSRAWLDLRAEPWVLSVPAVPAERYYVSQWFDLYTDNFGYVSVRATGRRAGNYLFAGPDWHGKAPRGIAKVFRSETSIVGTITRTSLAGPDDVPAVKALQAEFRLMPLSAFLHQSAPPPAPTPEWLKFSADEALGPGFIGYLNFLMTFMQPTPPSEKEMLARFARIGIGPGKPFDAAALDRGTEIAIRQGIGDAKQALAYRVWKTASTQDLFGTRAELGSDYVMKRAVGARMELHGNSKAEAIHPIWLTDQTHEPLLGSKRYEISFARGQLPPVNEFWAATVYRLPHRTLVDNPIDRYSLGSRSRGLQYGPDGSLTLYVQHDSPGKAHESNWLPAPDGPFTIFLRMYGPKSQALDDAWKSPDMTPVP